MARKPHCLCLDDDGGSRLALRTGRAVLLIALVFSILTTMGSGRFSASATAASKGQAGLSLDQSLEAALPRISPPGQEILDSSSQTLISLQPPSSPQSGQVVVDSSNPRWLRYNGGGPFFMCGPGDPEDFLYRGTRNGDGTRSGDQQSIINKLNSSGANSIYLMAVRSHGGDGDSTQNPFINSDPAQGLDEDILQQWDSWLGQLDDSGVLIFFIFYDDHASIWNTGDNVGAAEGAFITALVNRYEDLKHLIWVVAEEYGEAFSAARASNIAAGIAASDGRDHPIAVHKRNGLDFSEFADDPNIDQFAIQYTANNSGAFHSALVSAWSTANGRYNLNMAEGHPDAFGSLARTRSWAVAMGGGYIMHLRWDIADTALSDLGDCGDLVSFMEATDFNTMAPHDELTYGSSDYVLANPGTSYIAYTSSAGSSMGIRSLTSGTYNLRWLDTDSGSTSFQIGVSVTGGDTLWSKPSGLGTEIAVYAERTGPLPNTVPGDINGDGVVNIQDVQLCINQVLGTSATTPEADVNNDGSVNVQDIQLIVNIILGS